MTHDDAVIGQLHAQQITDRLRELADSQIAALLYTVWGNMRATVDPLSPLILEEAIRRLEQERDLSGHLWLVTRDGHMITIAIDADLSRWPSPPHEYRRLV